MKNIFTSKFIPVVSAISVLTLASCSKLDPKLEAPNSIAPNTSGGAPTPPSISAVYEQLNQLTGGQSNWFALEEHSTDEIMGPTRGTDWDDFGTWRRLHLHTWAGDHNQINDTWNGLNGALFQTTLVAETATGLTKAEGQFLRAYFRYLTCDLYGQVQTRPATAAAAAIPDVLTRSAAIDAIIAELEAAVPNLPVYNQTNRAQATKEAAWTLLAKCYLNKAVYKQDPTQPAGPFTFNAADMNKVIEYCNNVAANPLLAIDTYYWDNFKWDNGTVSSENIFVRKAGSDARAGNGAGLRWQTSQSWHYNQTPSSWNGFVTLSQFYDSFEDNDVRKKNDVPNYTNQVGAPAGFLLGQARGPVSPTNPKVPGVIGDPIGNLYDRSGNPLVFTRNASIFFNGEASGIRVNKFPLNPATINDGAWSSENEFPFFRFSDVRLMKAEALLRGGTTGANGETPLTIVNSIRVLRNATPLASVTLPTILAERGRELYLEGHRRTDMVRFGVFNSPVEERPNASAGYKVVYPIPTVALSSNPNLKQNFGY
ncbi:MAG: RagB/SusD family nutrient uptake outer membrane protein [Chitinophagaceae bacterium]|nr:RagB/SusD family nutrient uptake outer membrane protein [Chitinophagaceae bacterium]